MRPADAEEADLAVDAAQRFHQPGAERIAGLPLPRR